MEGRVIVSAFQRDPLIAPHFFQICYSDEIKPYIPKNSLVVVNECTSKSNLNENLHWLLISTFGAPEYVTFLDSYGGTVDESKLPHVASCLKASGKEIRFLLSSLQSSLATSHKNYYLLFGFLIIRSVTDVREIVSRIFNDNTKIESQKIFNDLIVCYLTKVLFSLKQEVINLLFDVQFHALQMYREKKQKELELEQQIKTKRKHVKKSRISKKKQNKTNANGSARRKQLVSDIYKEESHK